MSHGWHKGQTLTRVLVLYLIIQYQSPFFMFCPPLNIFPQKKISYWWKKSCTRLCIWLTTFILKNIIRIDHKIYRYYSNQKIPPPAFRANLNILRDECFLIWLGVDSIIQFWSNLNGKNDLIGGVCLTILVCIILYFWLRFILVY